MFEPLTQSGGTFWRRSLCLSLVLHFACVWLLSLKPKPIFVQPASIRFGEQGKYLGEIYLPSQRVLGEIEGESKSPRAVEKKAAPRKSLTLAKAQKSKGEPEVASEKTESETATASPAPAPIRAGSLNGSLLRGPGSTHETRIALPVIGPQPPIAASDLPMGHSGDVIVEITIDEKGNVVKTAVLQGIRGDLDQKVIATLMGWHFKPATEDGVPIPSQQDVHFHFGSN